MNYTYHLAEQKDEAELREFISSMPMPGAISIRFERNPNFFDASAVEGNVNETLLVREGNGRLSGIGNRSEKNVYLNGSPSVVGYLSGLRVDEKHRSLKFLSQAYKELQKLHEAGNAKIYLTSIVNENERAVKVLESGRGALPKYNFLGQYFTCVIASGKVYGSSEFDIRLAEQADMQALINFLNKNGREKQFFPLYKECDFSTGLLKDLDKVYLALKDGDICGCMGLWSQHSYKQLFIDSYSTAMNLIRPLYNIQAKLLKRTSLPPPGKAFNNLKVAVPLIKKGCEKAFYSLLAKLSQEAVKQKKPLLYGLHERDPFKEIAEQLSSKVYKSRIYAVYWPDGEQTFKKLEPEFIPYLELGGL